LYDASAAGAVNQGLKCRVVLLLLINSFHKLSNDQRHTLNALDLFLCSHQLSLQAPGGSQHLPCH
jgi:hypothetical protein